MRRTIVLHGPRFCRACDKRLTPKLGENIYNFRLRKLCDNLCSQAHQRIKRAALAAGGSK